MWLRPLDYKPNVLTLQCHILCLPQFHNHFLKDFPIKHSKLNPKMSKQFCERGIAVPCKYILKALLIPINFFAPCLESYVTVTLNL